MQKRIEFIDCLRGFTMILVVYHHLIGLCYEGEKGFMSDFFALFRMPMFFWISGFLAYSTLTTDILKKKLKNRFLGQLIPTIVIIALYDTWFGNYTYSGYINYAKDGYWFTFVMFMLFAIYAIIKYSMDNLKIRKNIQAIVLVVTAICAFIVNKIYFNSTDFLWILLSLRHVTYFACFFVFGVLSKMYYDWFDKSVNNKWVVTFIVLLYVLLYNISLKIPIAIFGFLGIVLIYRFFYFYKETFNTSTKVGTAFSYIGKNTLPIYFIHYFLLHYVKLGDVAHYLNNTSPLGG